MDRNTEMVARMATVILFVMLFFCHASGSPSSRAKCDISQCPKKGITKFYSEQKCQPIYDENSCCPVKYDCSSFTSRDTNKCYFLGEEYEKSSSVPSNKTTANCLAACSCIGGERGFICAAMDCAEFFGAFPVRDPSCYRHYSLNSCCSKGVYCPNSTGETFRCEYDGEKYKKGQRFIPKEECKQCICDEGFDGTTNGPWCQEKHCTYELLGGHYLRRGCVPVYLENSCCPNDWHCPSENDQIIEGPNHSTDASTQKSSENDLFCTFGNRILKLQDKLQPARLENVDCTCSIPPYLSCIQTSNT